MRAFFKRFTSIMIVICCPKWFAVTAIQLIIIHNDILITFFTLRMFHILIIISTNDAISFNKLSFNVATVFTARWTFCFSKLSGFDDGYISLLHFNVEGASSSFGFKYSPNIRDICIFSVCQLFRMFFSRCTGS